MNENLDIEKTMREITDRQVRAMGLAAAEYDGRFSAAYRAISEETIDRVLRPAQPGRVLDVATGTGLVLAGLRRGGYHAFGLDRTPEMLAVARSKLADAGQPSPPLVLGDARQLPFADGAFDAVTCLQFLHLLPREAQRMVLREMARVVKPGGLLLCDFYSPFWGIGLRATPIRRRQPRTVTWPWQIRDLFGPYRILLRVGLGFPGVNWLARTLGLRWARVFSRTLRFFPFNHLGNQLLVVARKEATASI